MVYAVKIYLAGGVSGNLKPFWKSVSILLAKGYNYNEAFDLSMKIFLAGVESRHWIQKELYADISRRNELFTPDNSFNNSGGGITLNETVPCKPSHADAIQLEGLRECDCFWQGSPRGGAGGGYDPIIREHKPFILESFYYADADTERLIPYYGDFLLDSGAFTFMQGNGGTTNLDEYIERYVDFIKRNKIEKYIELDIDVVVGYDKVKKIRTKLESEVGRQSIPVWHISRGITEFKKMCDEYNYVAVGGIVSGEIKKEKFGLLPMLVAEAHKRGAKIHGLGFTALDWLKVVHFDSVDSTAWTTGNRFGYLYYFADGTMKKKDVPKNHRLGDSRAAAVNNYTEWIKFQKYAEKHL